jgi:hypothetical protein
MRRFSLSRMTEATGRALRRFPMVLLAALVAGVTAAAAVKDGPGDPGWRNAAMAAALGIPLFLTIALVDERREPWRLPRLFRPLASVLGFLLLLVYGVTLPASIRAVDLYLYAQLTIGLHLLVAVLPLLRDEEGLLWRVDLALLLRFINAAFFSAVLYAGLSLALLAIDTLLGLEVDDLVYPRLWFVIAFVFNTAYFLGGAPPLGRGAEAPADPPRLVRVFAQHILAPLVVVYLVILLVYLVKVVATAVWPSGWIGYLVSSVAVAGLLSLMLLRPALDRAERGWIGVYARLFYFLMVPAVVMLALAVAKRIGQYGVTEPRYFLVVLTAWLAVVVLLGCRRPVPSLKAIPLSLAVLAFLTAVGPWSAYAMAHRSQLGRLGDLLAANARLVEGRIVPSPAEASSQDEREISRLLHYLFDHFGHDALGDAASDALRAELDATVARYGGDTAPATALAEAVAGYVTIDYVMGPAPRAGGWISAERSGRLQAVPVGGWEHLVALNVAQDDERVVVLDADTCQVALDWPAEQLLLQRGDEVLGSVPLDALMASLRALDPGLARHVIPDSLLDVDGTGAGRRLRLRVEKISWTGGDGEPERARLIGDLLIGRARE